MTEFEVLCHQFLRFSIKDGPTPMTVLLSLFCVVPSLSSIPSRSHSGSVIDDNDDMNALTGMDALLLMSR
jgi:hypothetical protein